MKYRIVKEVDGNGSTHYEVHFYKKYYGMVFANWEWRPVEELKYVEKWKHDCWVTKRFPTLEDAEQCVREHDKGRTIIKQGEIGDGKLPK